MKAYIKRISYYLPPKIPSNGKLIGKFPEWTADRIASKVRASNQHAAGEQETVSDVAVAAANNLFAINSDTKRESIDFMLFCIQSPDYFLSISACLIQEQLGLRINIEAIDYSLGCSGYAYGLAAAKGLIIRGIARNMLLLTAETYPKFLRPRDKGNRTILGDATSASTTSTEGFIEIEELALGTDGRGANNLIIRTEASREKKTKNDLSFDENGNSVSSDHLYMNGAEILTFIQRNALVAVRDTLLKNNLEQPEINLSVLHQVNKYMLNFLQKKMKIEREESCCFPSEVGNTVLGSIPLTLCEVKRENRLNGSALLIGFRAGYSWVGVVLKAWAGYAYCL